MKSALFLASMLLIMLAGCQATPAPTPSPTPLPTVMPTPFSGSARVKLDDISVYFEAHGQGKPLILLHGGLGSADDWVNQIPVFSQQYRVIAPDSRAQGRTTDSEAPISYHLMAEDTLRLMDTLEIDSAYIVGWSDGAIIGLDLAIHHPERVKALVAYAANISPDGLRENVIGYLRYSSAATLQRDLGSEYLRLSPQPERLPTVIEKIKTMWLTEPNFTVQELAGIRTPTLIVDGENEEVIRAGHAQAIANAIPGAELILLSDVGHFAMARKPDEWNKVVLDFLKDK
jgi:pimeloyl-ACP methyl ester carboxylesterase